MQRIHAAIAGPTNSRDRVDSCLKRIDALNDQLKAMISPLPAAAMADAERCDRATASGRWLGLLHGTIISLKDNIDTAGIQTTYGSDFYRGHVPEVDAEVVRRLKNAGAIIMGKDNLHEFALGLTSQNPHYGACRNPWDSSRIPGGSSGGSAVAIATGMTEAALGTDSGGSGRIPASANGIAALRPTLGRISTTGVAASSPNLATVSPMSRHVSDIARIFAVLNAHDAQDPASSTVPRRDVLTDLRKGIAGVRIGRPEEFFFDDVPADITAAVQTALDVLSDLGASIVPITLPDSPDAQYWQSILLQSDSAQRHRQRIIAEPERFGANLLQRLRSGMEVSGTDYSAALQWRTAWTRSVQSAFQHVDLIASPTLPVAPPLAEPPGAPTAPSRVGQLAAAWSMAGIPAMSIPCGFDALGLPVGLQLAADQDQEPLLLRAGVAYQESTDWHLSRTPV